jgi:hypothetical protein
MTEPIITLIHCPRCNTNMLIAWLDQVRAHALAEHQAGRSEAPCRPARKTDQ